MFAQQTALVTKLALHQSRRCQHIPTLSVLVGGGLAVQAVWYQWLAQTQRQSVLCSDDAWLSLLQTCLTTVAKHHDVRSLAMQRLANIIERPLEQLALSLTTSSYQQQLFWQSLNLAPLEASWLRWLLELSPTGQKLPTWLDGSDLTTIATGFSLVAGLLAKDDAPAILINAAANHPISPSSATRIVQLVERIPSFPIGLWLTQDGLTMLPTSRVKTIMQSGLIEVKTPELQTLKQWLCDRNITSSTQQRPILNLTQQYGATPELLEAAVTLTQPPAAADEQQYRSQAEWFLHQCLEARPQTAGLFKVNAKLDIRFGNRPMEVDFLAADTKIVIEIDGYYHFQSPNSYRRDRRKDVELQHQGFLILRFLADDIVTHLEEILGTIDRAITLRSA